MFNKNGWFLNFQKEFLNFSFCIRKLAVAFYMINEIQPKIKFQNIVQCPFNMIFKKFWALLTQNYFFSLFLPFSQKLKNFIGIFEVAVQDAYELQKIHSLGQVVLEIVHMIAETKFKSENFKLGIFKDLTSHLHSTTGWERVIKVITECCSIAQLWPNAS